MSVCLFVFRNGKRKEKRWEGRPSGRCMVCKNMNFAAHKEQSLQFEMLSSEIVNPTIKLPYVEAVETAALAN